MKYKAGEESGEKSSLKKAKASYTSSLKVVDQNGVTGGCGHDERAVGHEVKNIPQFGVYWQRRQTNYQRLKDITRRLARLGSEYAPAINNLV